MSSRRRPRPVAPSIKQRNSALQVLLVHRKADPFAVSWALPGGFKRPDETLDDAAIRELREETGVDAPRHLAQFGAYGDPGRDPRTNVVTIGFLAVTPDIGDIIAGSDADDVRLWSVADRRCCVVRSSDAANW